MVVAAAVVVVILSLQRFVVCWRLLSARCVCVLFVVCSVLFVVC